MHPRMQELLDFMDEQYAAFCTVADAVPPAERERPPADGSWSVAQIVDHVGRVEGMFAHFVTKAMTEAQAQGIAAETETSSVLSPALLQKVMDRSVRRHAPAPAHPAPDARYDEVRAVLDQAHRRGRELLASADGLALETITMPHPALGVLNLYDWGVAVGGHEARHAAQIRELAAPLPAAPAGDGAGGA
jgi:hypothetical protein